MDHIETWSLPVAKPRWYLFRRILGLLGLAAIAASCFVSYQQDKPWTLQEIRDQPLIFVGLAFFGGAWAFTVLCMLKDMAAGIPVANCVLNLPALNLVLAGMVTIVRIIESRAMPESGHFDSISSHLVWIGILTNVLICMLELYYEARVQKRA